MSRESLNLYASFKSDRARLWALISRDLRIVAVAAICAGATGVSPALSDAILRWL
ncbi:MAG: hypothetical protein K2Y02_00410 [Burkholderiaceae bacterium]|nr:hypothetical protein [Burkholderiaceae bacterium]